MISFLTSCGCPFFLKNKKEKEKSTCACRYDSTVMVARHHIGNTTMERSWTGGAGGGLGNKTPQRHGKAGLDRRIGWMCVLLLQSADRQAGSCTRACGFLQDGMGGTTATATLTCHCRRVG
jgi:hypothetical protein